MHRSLRSCWLPLCLMLFGCLRDEAVPASTQVTLRVSSEQALLEELTELSVSVALSDGEGWRKPVVKTFSSAVLRWPVDLPIVPRTRDDETKQIEIVVDALHDGQRLAQGRTITVFVHGEQVTRELRLFACPDHEPGFVCASDGCAGSSCEVCRSDGSCTPVGGPDSDPDDGVTPDMDSGEDSGGPEDDADSATTPEPDAALLPTDGSAAKSDADAKSPVEFGLAAAGQPCDTLDESSLSCEGHAARSVLKCQQGTWQAFRTCAANERCESRVGTELGSCVQIPNACVGKSAGPICDGTVRLECGIDLVTVVSRPCPEHTHCEEAGGARCACDAGYRDDGSGSCVNPNDCPAGACSGGSCIDGLAEYTCDCNSGFAGTGTKACSPVLYCPKDACTPGGTCTDTMSWSCQCNSGFSGTGGKACANIDDCPQDRCKAPNGVCKDAVGSYTCTCNPGFSGTDCVNDICAPNPCRNGGTCARTGTLCTCPQGYGGANCQTDACSPNPCLNGGVCSRTGTRCSCPTGYSGATCEQDACAALTCNRGTCVRSASGASCNCAGSGFTGAACDMDVNECAAGAAAACGTGALSCSNTAGSYVCTCSGAYVASADGKSCRLRAWHTAQLVGSDVSFDQSAYAIAAYVNTDVAWLKLNGSRSDVWISQAGPSGPWGNPTLLETDNSGNATSTALVMTTFSSIFTIWSQFDGTRYNVLSNWYKVSPTPGWSGATLVDRSDTGSAEMPAIATDWNDHPIAVWSQSDGTRTNILSSRYQGGWSFPTLVETNDSRAIQPRVGMDRDGYGFAIWLQEEGNQYNVWANQYSPSSSTWGTPKLLENATGGIGSDIQLAVNSSAAVAVWTQVSGSSIDVWASCYQAGAWGTATRLESGSGNAHGPRVGLDGAGNAIVTWIQTDQNNEALDSVWSARHLLASNQWETATLVERSDLGTADQSAIAVDSSGNAVAVWIQYDGSRFNLWANRYLAGGSWGTPVLIETDNTGSAYAPKLALDLYDNVIAIWMQQRGSSYDLWSNRFD